MFDKEISREERVQKVDHFTKQLINSGYSWSQSRDIIVSALKGMIKREMREKVTGAERYRTGEDSLEDRLRKHLTEATELYKEGRRAEPDEGEIGENLGDEKERSRAWKGWRVGRKMGRKLTDMNDKKVQVESNVIRGVLFLPYTENLELA